MQTGPLQLGAGLCFIILFVLVGATVTYFTIERPGRDLFRGRKVTTQDGNVGQKNSVSSGL
jgi:hypothetical protein